MHIHVYFCTCIFPTKLVITPENAEHLRWSWLNTPNRQTETKAIHYLGTTESACVIHKSTASVSFRQAQVTGQGRTARKEQWLILEVISLLSYSTTVFCTVYSTAVSLRFQDSKLAARMLQPLARVMLVPLTIIWESKKRGKVTWGYRQCFSNICTFKYFSCFSQLSEASQNMHVNCVCLFTSSVMSLSFLQGNNYRRMKLPYS